MDARDPVDVIPRPLGRAVDDLGTWFVIGGQAVRCFCPYRPSRDVDLGVRSVKDLDEDGDGYTRSDCAGGDDCDDADETAFPGSIAVDCSAADHDCNGEEDQDNDGDGDDRLACTGGGDCDDTDPAVSSLVDEANCDGLDTDCDGEMSLFEDADQDGYAKEGCVAAGSEVDCNDGDDTIAFGAGNYIYEFVELHCDN